MEWVEISADDVDTAKELALDRLGVAEAEAEFDVLEEPRPGLFGRTRGEARVRARVRPRSPRPKAESRRRGGDKASRRRSGGRDGGRDTASPESPARSESDAGRDTEPATGGAARRGGRSSSRRSDLADAPAASTGRASTSRRRRDQATPQPKEEPAVSDVTIEEQARIASDFMDGLVDAFGYQNVEVAHTIDDDAVQVEVTGTDLGLLIGPKGQTMQAVQELMRTAVQRETQGGAQARIRLDIGGYRAKRAEALAEFTRRVADEVKETGVEKALEPMHPADRKVVHDTVNEIDGVETYSEGEEPRRRVVIRPVD